MLKKCVLGIMAFVLVACLFAACSRPSSTVFEMELNRSYDDSDPFVNARLFYVADDTESVKFDSSLKMNAGTGLLEIVENETDNVVWQNSWTGKVDEKFEILLDNLKKDTDYAIRLTCTQVESAKLKMTSGNRLLRERERPRRMAVAK